MHTCSSCQRNLPADDYYHYSLAGADKRIRDQRCKPCRKILTQGIHRRHAAAKKALEANVQLVKQAILRNGGDQFYTPVVFPKS